MQKDKKLQIDQSFCSPNKEQATDEESALRAIVALFNDTDEFLTTLRHTTLCERSRNDNSIFIRLA